MTVYINGTTGLSGVDGSAGTPAVQGTDTNTGVFYPAADTVGVSTGGSERVRVDSSGNVGIGTSSPGQRLEVSNSSTNTTFSTAGNQLLVRNSGSTANAFARLDFAGSTSNPNASIAAMFENYGTGATSILFGNINTGTGSLVERMRIDSSGNLLVGTTSANFTFSTLSGNGVGIASNYSASYGQIINSTNATGTQYFIGFGRNGSGCGNISSTATNSTTYATSSDYRLKENVKPMQNALEKVSLLKPVTYTWKEDGTAGQGFIAHELAEVVPDAVVGEKDKVDANGTPVYQGIDASFLVATLTAAIQEQQAIIQSLTDRITALENK